MGAGAGGDLGGLSRVGKAVGVSAHSAIRSINDVLSELVAGLAAGETPTKGWAYLAVGTLAEHTRELGGEPSITPEAIDHWAGEE